METYLLREQPVSERRQRKKLDVPLCLIIQIPFIFTLLPVLVWL